MGKSRGFRVVAGSVPLTLHLHWHDCWSAEATEHERDSVDSKSVCLLLQQLRGGMAFVTDEAAPWQHPVADPEHCCEQQQRPAGN